MPQVRESSWSVDSSGLAVSSPIVSNSIRLLVSTWAAGDMQSEGNRARFFRQYGLDPSCVALGLQTHGRRIGLIKTLKDVAPNRVNAIDGWTCTGVRGAALGVFIADCLPVFIVDPAGSLGVLLHVGWRGLAGGIIEEAKTLLGSLGRGDRDLAAAIGPHIRACCYDVGQDTADSFDPALSRRRDGKIYLDLEKGVIRQLSDWGIGPIYVSGDCTKCSEEPLFFSRRKEAQGTQLALLHFS